MERQILHAKSMIVCVALAVAVSVRAHDEEITAAGHWNGLPHFISGPVIAKHYPNDSTLRDDDLLTGGLGKLGIEGPVPLFANAQAPTADELRRRALHTNYRAVMDPTPAGGFGTLYGPNVDNPVDPVEGRIPGWEYLAYADDGSGRKNVTLVVQVPDHFDKNNACIVTGTSSGSRGVYGAIGTAGEWGLKHGCAVTYTDKGTGNGLHDLNTNAVGLIDGVRTSADVAGTASHFTANLTDERRSAFNADWPDRVAYKHAHSQQNPERDWGRNTLQAVRFAFWVLNDRYGVPTKHGVKKTVFDRRNTIVIASSISNGGAGALQAAEQDRFGLIDGVAISEPNAQPGDVGGLRIRQGATEFATIGKSLYDYFTFANLYQPCAALAVGASAPAFAFLGFPNPTGAVNRCSGLAAKGLVTGVDTAAQAADALAKLHTYGWLPESDPLHASHYRFASNAIAVTYSNAYGRFSVADNLCGFSFANTDLYGYPTLQDDISQASIFATGNGVPPTTGVNIVYNLSEGIPVLDLLAKSPSTGSADFALDGALCHRALATGIDPVTGTVLTGYMKRASRRVRQGIAEVELTARLHGMPAIIVHGRSDALVPINHSSRAYYGKAQLVDARGNRNLRYIEVTNAQHFDAFLPSSPFPGYDTHYVPLHVYFSRAMDWMYEHLKHGKRLPPSQVVRAIPRGGEPGAAPALTAANVPEILGDPAAGDKIRFEHNTLHVPD